MLEEENKTRKENMWYGTITEENLMRKVSESTVQEEYHRLIGMLSFFKKELNGDIKTNVQSLKNKGNISSVYKVQLNHLVKESSEVEY